MVERGYHQCQGANFVKIKHAKDNQLQIHSSDYKCDTSLQ